MRSFLKVACILGMGFVGAHAFGASSLGVEDAITLQKGSSWNTVPAKVTATTIRFTQKDGKAFRNDARGYMDIGGTNYIINKADTLTVPDLSTAWNLGSDIGTLYLYAAPTGTKFFTICASDLAHLQLKGSVASGNSGYVACASTVASTAAMRLVGRSVVATANTLGTPIVTLPEGVITGTQSSATTATTLEFAVTGLTANNKCFVTPVSLGTDVNYFKTVTPGADKIDIVVDTAQSGSETVINFVCW